MATTNELRYVRCLHCNQKFNTVRQTRKHIADIHSIPALTARSKVDYTAVYGKVGSKPRGLSKRGTGTSTNLKHVLCKHCKKNFSTYRAAITHLTKAHNMNPEEIRAERDYKGMYKTKPGKTKNKKAVHAKHPPANNKTTPQPEGYTAVPGMTELVIPVYIKIPLVVGQPVVIEPMVERS